MATQGEGPSAPYLERFQHRRNPAFKKPCKEINNGDDLTFFLSSMAYRDLMTWLLQLNRAMFPIKDTNGKVHEISLSSPPAYSDAVQGLRALLSDLASLVNNASPDTGPRRFGNVAFRTWFKLADDGAEALIEKYLGAALQRWSAQDQRRDQDLRDELKVYLLASFGSAQRLDYGTGHELSFLAFLGCLWKLGMFEDGEERAVVMGLVQPYLDLIRTLVQTYTLEPAGSHGVWGLDDHSFVPYIFGSAQLGPVVEMTTPTPVEGSLPEAPSPSAVTNKRLVQDYKDRNMYFSAIQFIYDVKRGPFWEHSPVLYDVSGIKDGWGKINKGMLKMYAAEVLGKFPVVQHFPFGSFFNWKADPEPTKPMQQGSVHAQNQPTRSMDVPHGPPPGIAAGTKAPWASNSGGQAMPQIHSVTGMPSTRAPWAGSSMVRPSGAATVSTAVPGVTTQRLPPSEGSGMVTTAAPWARREGDGR